MVKRQAEKQLTDSNWNDPDPDDTPSTGILKTASPQAISRRQIRALPKKSGVSASTAHSKFGAAPSLFTNGKTSSPPFGQLSQSVNPTPFNLFGGSSSFGTAKSSAFGSAPSAMPNPSNSAEPLNTQALTTYYASLRGLNLCALKSFEGLIKKDAFTDLSTAFDHVKKNYNQHRQEIEAELERSEPSATGKTGASATAEIPTKSPFAFPITTGAKNEASAKSPFALPTTGAKNEAPAKSPFSFSTNGAHNQPPVNSPFTFAGNGTHASPRNGISLSAAAETRSTTSPLSASSGNAAKSLTEGVGFGNSAASKAEIKPSSDEVDDHSSSSDNASTGPAAKASSRPGAFTMAAPIRPSPLRYESQESPASSPAPQSCDEAAKSVASLASNNESSKPQSSLSSSDSVNQQPKPATGSFAGSSPAPFSLSETKSKTASLFGTNGPSAHAALSFSESKSKTASLFGTNGASATGPSLFGSSSSTKPFSFVSPSTENPTAKPAKVSLSFGVGGAGNGSAFGGFGPPKSVQATPPKNGYNPVGFSFGSSPPTSSAFTIKTPDLLPAGTGSTPNSSTADEKSKVDGDSPAGQESSDGTGTSTGFQGVDSNLGEEEEETLFQTNGRVYALLDKQQDDGKVQKSWVGWAVSTVKLNRHKETKRCRILARSQVNQSILINFFVRPDLKPMDRGSSVEFIGFDPAGTQLQAYRVRPPSAQVVEEFIKAIQDVIDSPSLARENTSISA